MSSEEVQRRLKHVHAKMLGCLIGEQSGSGRGNVEDSESARASYRCALAIVGGRFPDLRSAILDPEFKLASPTLVKQTVGRIKDDSFAVQAVEFEEEERRAALQEAFVSSTDKDGSSTRTDLAWLETVFSCLMARATSADVLKMNLDDLRIFRWCFELADKSDRRFWAYKFQYLVHTSLVQRSEEKQQKCVVGSSQLHSLAFSIFRDGAYCSKQIADAVKHGRETPPDMGRPVNFPREVETVLFRWVSMMRLNDIQVYQSTVIDKAMQLLEGTEASLYFARVRLLTSSVTRLLRSLRFLRSL